MVGLELSIADGEELHLSSPGNKPEPAADASRDESVRLRAPAIAGVAEVQFLTAGNVEFKADLAMNSQVGLSTVPAAPMARMRA